MSESECSVLTALNSLRCHYTHCKCRPVPLRISVPLSLAKARSRFFNLVVRGCYRRFHRPEPRDVRLWIGSGPAKMSLRPPASPSSDPDPESTLLPALTSVVVLLSFRSFVAPSRLSPIFFDTICPTSRVV